MATRMTRFHTRYAIEATDSFSLHQSMHLSIGEEQYMPSMSARGNCAIVSMKGLATKRRAKMSHHDVVDGSLGRIIGDVATCGLHDPPDLKSRYFGTS